MRQRVSKGLFFLIVCFTGWSVSHAAPDELAAFPAKIARTAVGVREKAPVLWQDPGNIRSRNMIYGAGGIEHRPVGPYTFIKEDEEGSNPKFVVKDRNGVTWKVKLGVEARPETVASRFVWAVGYFTPEEYFVENLKLQNKPPKLRRGGNLMKADGSFSNARLKRENKDEKKLGDWSWRKNEALPAREYNGLRVMMALVNNWDLKDVNNAVYAADGQEIYMVSDLGGTFGTPGLSWSQKKSKGNLKSYRDSKFITKTTDEYVNFATPARPALINVVALPNFIMRLRLRAIGKHVPRDHAQWMGELLARLSPAQIRDAFRAGGYSPRETEAFARIVEQRIAMLNQL